VTVDAEVDSDSMIKSERQQQREMWLMIFSLCNEIVLQEDILRGAALCGLKTCLWEQQRHDWKFAYTLLSPRWF